MTRINNIFWIMTLIKILIVVAIFSCNSKKEDKTKYVSSANTTCSLLEEKQNLIQTMLDIPEIQQYYRSDYKNVDTIYIQKSELVWDSLRLNKLDKPVKILTKDEILQRKIIHYIDFKIALPADSIDFLEKVPVAPKLNEHLPNRVYGYLVMSSQGMGCATILNKKENCKWKVEYANIFEE